MLLGISVEGWIYGISVVIAYTIGKYRGKSQFFKSLDKDYDEVMNTLKSVNGVKEHLEKVKKDK